MQSYSPPTGPQTVAVSIVLRDPLLRMGVLAALRSDERFIPRIDWESSDGLVDDRLEECLSTANVLVADYEAGLAIAEHAGGRTVLPRIMIVTQRNRESDIRRALEEGVLGYVLVGCAVEEIIGGVMSVHMGQRHLGYSAAQRIADSFTYQRLTEREVSVLCLVAGGLSNKLVARQLNISVGTVKSHVRSIFDKLRVRTRTQAAAEAQRRGLVEPEGTTHLESANASDYMMGARMRSVTH